MSTLIKQKFYVQQRVDVHHIKSLEEHLASDYSLFTKATFTEENLILTGFEVTGLGSTSASITIDGSKLIHGADSGFSFFVADAGAPAVTVTAADLVDNTRNYLEIYLEYVDGTPLSTVFLDPTTLQEFYQIVPTQSVVNVKYEVRTGSFSGAADRIPVAVLDTDAGGIIKVIQDKRNLFFRLGRPDDIFKSYSLASDIEPVYTITMTGTSGTFTAGETVTIAGVITATVVTGGTASITVNKPSSTAFTSGDSVLGADSGATGTVNTISEAFSGADKDITSIKQLFDAFATQLKDLKGTEFWYQSSTTSILAGLRQINSVFTQKTDGAKFYWDGSNLSITDKNASPADADQIAQLDRFETDAAYILTRQDGTGGSAVIPVTDDFVVYITIPASGSRTFTGVGTTDTNFKTVLKRDFIVDEFNYWVAYRRGTQLYVRGLGELAPGESAEVGQNTYDDVVDEFQRLRISEHTANKQRVSISGTSVILSDDIALKYKLDQREVFFNGAEIDFSTGAIYESDGTTPLGNDFTPETIGSTEYFWYSVTLVPDTINADGTVTGKIRVLKASGSNAVAANAPKPRFSEGIALGFVRVQENGGGGIEDILAVNGDIIQIKGAVDSRGFIQTTLLDNTTGTVLEDEEAGSKNWIIDYSLTRSTDVENGTILMVSDGTNVYTSVDFSGTSLSGVDFTGDISSGNIRLRYTLTSTGNNATMRYSVRNWGN